MHKPNFKILATKLKPNNIFHALKKSIRSIAKGFHFVATEFVAFYVLISLYLVDELVVNHVLKSRFIPYALTKPIVKSYGRIYQFAQDKLDRSGGESISKLELVQLSFRNMKVKRTRTLITIGGVSIGIASIVFLVSLGYGLQELVVNRVARLDELRQADVFTQPGSKVRIDDKVLADIKGLGDVEDVYPLIAVVGRVNYNNSISDMAAYGVTTKYLEKSAIKPVRGKIFESYELAFKQTSDASAVQDIEERGEVAGASTKKIFGKNGQKLSDTKYSIAPEQWIRVREGLGTNTRVLGYTKRDETNLSGELYLGPTYIDTDFGTFSETEDGTSLGVWVRSKVKLWELTDCKTAIDSKCIDDKYLPVLNGNDVQESKNGYFAVINVTVPNLEKMALKEAGDVLGESTTSTPQVLASETKDVNQSTPASPLGNIKIDDTSEFVEIIDPESAPKDAVSKVKISSQAVKQAVVNRAMLQLLGIKEEDAVGKKFSVSFVIPSELVNDPTKRVESEAVDYTISGVTIDDANPIIYVPFVDLRSLGIVNYTQFKVDAKENEALDKIRKQIESYGFSTQSVVDTVEQINSLFKNIRLVLGIVGTVALAVASLGMFNTLTISLLERSREVGLMKAMGMKTAEVQELFLTESIIMGSCAGLFGLLIGFLFGKLVGLVLTFFSVFKGQGFIDVTHLPLSFVIIIMALSVLVGMLTGLYPAKRSTKISALDALRYE